MRVVSKNILITGASGAFGKLTVMTLLKKGHTVVASMRDIQGKNRDIAHQLEKMGAYVVEIDVRDNQSVITGVESAIKQVGILDVLINNAGIGAYGLQETFTSDDWKKIFDVNVFGVQRMNRAVLPHMRHHNSGLLIYISSLIGRMTLPFWGAYGASKWALEALAEGYRVELLGLGIDSCLVEPGPFPTTFFENLIVASDTERNESYGDFSKVVKDSFVDFGKNLSSNQKQKPQNIADAIAVLIDTPDGNRNFRTIVDNIGIGKHIYSYNDKLEQITSAVYKEFGMADMLDLRVYK
jgi:NADP-dependent 3-hydroxy acid dehydrogenase YdfG